MIVGNCYQCMIATRVTLCLVLAIVGVAVLVVALAS